MYNRLTLEAMSYWHKWRIIGNEQLKQSEKFVESTTQKYQGDNVVLELVVSKIDLRMSNELMKESLLDLIYA